MKTLKLKNGFLVTPAAVIKSDLLIRGNSITLNQTDTPAQDTVDLAGSYVVPGFVDNHFHGYNLFGLQCGQYDPHTKSFDTSESAYKNGLDMLRRELAKFGVTGLYLATSAMNAEKLRYCFDRLRDYLSHHHDSTKGSRLWGGMLEGSFISRDMAGAQNPEFIFEPVKESFDQIQDEGIIKLANVAPDYGPPAVKLTEYLSGKGIVVGAGHTNATADQVAAAFAAGLKFCIHFTNGPTGTSFKPFDGGGTVEAVLLNDEIYAEIIFDGYHVNPLYIRDIVLRKGVERVIGITDCTTLAGSNIKEYEAGGIKAQISENGEYIKLVGKKNALAGSMLTMNRGFNNMLNLLTRRMPGIWTRRHEAYDFADALVAAVKMYSTNPCELTGKIKEGFGAIEDGAKADLCVLDIQGQPGNYKAEVTMTFVAGEKVFVK